MVPYSKITVRVSGQQYKKMYNGNATAHTIAKKTISHPNTFAMCNGKCVELSVPPIWRVWSHTYHVNRKQKDWQLEYDTEYPWSGQTENCRSAATDFVSNHCYSSISQRVFCIPIA